MNYRPVISALMSVMRI